MGELQLVSRNTAYLPSPQVESTQMLLSQLQPHRSHRKSSGASPLSPTAGPLTFACVYTIITLEQRHQEDRARKDVLRQCRVEHRVREMRETYRL